MPRKTKSPAKGTRKGKKNDAKSAITPSKLSDLEPLFAGLLDKPETFISQPEEKVISSLAAATKTLYDTAKEDERIGVKSLKSLVVKGFDAEQIWGELELHNSPLLTLAQQKLTAMMHDDDESDSESDLGGNKHQPADDHDIDDSDRDEDGAGAGGGDADEDDGGSAEDDEANDEEADEDAEEYDAEEPLDDESEEDADAFADAEEAERQKRGAQRATVAEDQFFSLAELEQFADEPIITEDADPEMSALYGDGLALESEDDEDQLGEEEEMDFLGPNADPFNTGKASGRSLDRNKKGTAGAGRARNQQHKPIMYSDFFDDTGGGGGGDADFEGRDDDEDEEEYDEIVEEANDEPERAAKDEKASASAAADQGPMSRYERQKASKRKQIEDLESKIVGSRSWDQTGEVTAMQRPADSLLERPLEFDYIGSVPPDLTEERAVELEDLIKQRIVSDQFDDVIRQVKPKEKKYRQKEELSQEKSTMGLAEVYEKQYVQKAMDTGDDDGVDPAKREELANKHKEIASLVAGLFHKLDALCNFHFTPKPPTDELEVQTQAPAIAMEEVIPMGVSSAQVASAADVYRSQSQGVPVDKREMSRDEKQSKRKRKKSKRKKQMQAQEDEERAVAMAQPESAAGKKYMQKKALEEARKEHRAPVSAAQAGADTMQYTKSKAFFSRIQEQADDERRRKQKVEKEAKVAERKKSSKSDKSAAKLKL